MSISKCWRCCLLTSRASTYAICKSSAWRSVLIKLNCEALFSIYERFGKMLIVAQYSGDKFERSENIDVWGNWAKTLHTQHPLL